MNASIWESAEALASFAFRTAHAKFYRKRAEWFDPAFSPALALWWTEAGHIPDIHHMLARWRLLKEKGPTKHAFGWDGVAGAERWRALRCA